MKPSQEQIDRASFALTPFVTEWDLPLNPENLGLMAFAALSFADSEASWDDIDREVRQWIAEDKAEAERMREAMRASVERPISGELLEHYSMIDPAIRQASVSTRELVVPEDMAIEAVRQFDAAGITQIGWEGWLVDVAAGSQGHSPRYQGTSGFFDAAECLTSIREDAAAYRANPEEPGCQLYFCLTPDLTHGDG